MKDFEELLDSLIKENINMSIIEMTDIPNIDLYMDQITTFMETKLNGFKRSADDKILTKTMINNYTKSKLFPPPTKKKYTKNHIMLLIIIYHLKSMLSIYDINRLLSPITDELKVNESSETLEMVYQNFVYLQKHSSINKIPNLKESYEKILNSEALKTSKNKEQIQFILIVLMLSIESNTEKRIAEKIIDQFF